MEDISSLNVIPKNIDFETIQNQNLNLKKSNAILITIITIFGIVCTIIFIIKKEEELKYREKNNL